MASSPPRKRTYPVASGSKPPTAKRARKKGNQVTRIVLNDAKKTEDNTIRLVTVGDKSRTGRFDLKVSTVEVEPIAPPPVVPDEDVNAPDAEQWHDMLGDSVIPVVKLKRKQRNDSVSSRLPEITLDSQNI